jgi:hypothetical protein
LGGYPSKKHVNYNGSAELGGTGFEENKNQKGKDFEVGSAAIYWLRVIPKSIRVYPPIDAPINRAYKNV